MTAQYGPFNAAELPEHLRCSSAAHGGLHAYLDLSKPYFCVLCQEENETLKASWKSARDRQVAIGARTNYQARIQGVAIQLLSQFMQANMIRDMGQVIRDTNTVKAPMALTEMLDMSLAGAIHFVTELSKLQPGEKYIDQFGQQFDAQQGHNGVMPVYPT